MATSCFLASYPPSPLPKHCPWLWRAETREVGVMCSAETARIYRRKGICVPAPGPQPNPTKLTTHFCRHSYLQTHLHVHLYADESVDSRLGLYTHLHTLMGT